MKHEMAKLNEKNFEAKRLVRGLIVKHTCIRTKIGLGSLNEDLRGLMGVQVEQAGEWEGIQHLLPS